MRHQVSYPAGAQRMGEAVWLPAVRDASQPLLNIVNSLPFFFNSPVMHVRHSEREAASPGELTKRSRATER